MFVNKTVQIQCSQILSYNKRVPLFNIQCSKKLVWNNQYPYLAVFVPQILKIIYFSRSRPILQY